MEGGPPSKTSTFLPHLPPTHNNREPQSTQKPQSGPSSTNSATETDAPCAHVGKQHTTPVTRNGQQAACCLMQRSVTSISFLFQSRIRTVHVPVLTLSIHDEQVTMVEPARVRTGLRLPFEECCNSTKQRLVIAFPKTQGSQRLAHLPQHHGFIRGTIALHNPRKQHRSPVHGPIASPCSHEHSQRHEDTGCTAQSVR